MCPSVVVSDKVVVPPQVGRVKNPKLEENQKGIGGKCDFSDVSRLSISEPMFLRKDVVYVTIFWKKFSFMFN
jgi:hypothetical protein